MTERRTDYATLRCYLASPGNQAQAHMAEGMPVLVSYASFAPWMERYVPSFGRLLVDSGAFSVMTTGKHIDVAEYASWATDFSGRSGVDAWAGLDDIEGDWRKSLKNYEHGGFPTFHDTDPWELLPELVDMARQRGRWLGIGLKPPRTGKREFVERVLEQVPADLHIHGWALRIYSSCRRIDSVDSTNWWRDGMDVRTKLPWLTYTEALEIVVKRYQRWARLNDEEKKITRRTMKGLADVD